MDRTQQFQWFRSWHGAPTDSKWLFIAQRAKTQPGIVAYVFWSLEDYASQNSDRGSVAGFDVDVCAAFSGFDATVITAVLTAFAEKGIVTAEHRLASWEKRQPKREDNSTPRVREYRERNAGQTSLLPDDGIVTQCNAVQRDVTQINAPEKIKRREDIDTYTECTADKPPAPEPEREKAKAEPEPEPAERAEALPEVRPAPAKAPAERQPNRAYTVAQLLAQVCGMDLGTNKGRLLREAKTLLGATSPPFDEAILRERYAAGGWWWENDWRGLKGEPPRPEAVRETWGRWVNSQGERNDSRHRGNGTAAGRGYGLTSITTDRDRAYHAANSSEAIEAARAEWDSFSAGR